MYFYNQKMSTTKCMCSPWTTKFHPMILWGVHFTVKAYHSTWSPVSPLWLILQNRSSLSLRVPYSLSTRICQSSKLQVSSETQFKLLFICPCKIKRKKKEKSSIDFQHSINIPIHNQKNGAIGRRDGTKARPNPAGYTVSPGVHFCNMGHMTV